MKVLFVVLLVGASVSALQNQYAPSYNNIDDNSGQYVPDDSGQYIPDDSGRYIPDHSGDYTPDGLGIYSGDGSGNYSGDGSGGYKGDGSGGYKGDGSGAYKGDGSGAYKGDGSGAYKGDGSGGFGGSGSGGFGGSGSGGQYGYGHGGGSGNGGSGSGSGKLGSSSFNAFGSSNLLGQGSNSYKQILETPSFPSTGSGSSSLSLSGSGSGSSAFGNTAAATAQVVLPVSKVPAYGSSNPNLSGVRYDSGRYADGKWKIIRQSGDVDTDGYHWEYETENGISAEESGKLYNKGTDLEAMKAKGFFQYTGPDNVLYQVTYTADENGFIPTGNHIPTPPPIPGLIVKALDYLKSTGKL